ncbi:hypothetical protein Tco_0512511 [Tanacetum coccineum]
METDLLSNPSEIAAPKLMKKMADIYFTRVTKNAESTFSLSPRQMALWTSQREDHTSDWLRTVPISGLGQTMNACSRVFAGDIYGDHAVSCAGIIGIKHRHNVVRDTLVDICYRSGISAGKEVDIGLDGGRDKPLRPADMLLYSWDGGLDVCVDLTGSSPLTQTGMVDFVPGRAVIDAAQRKRGKYMAKCAAIGYGFLPFSFSSFGELEADAVTLLKRIRKFSMAQDIGARAAVHIFNRISFAIAKGVGAQIVSRLPSNLLLARHRLFGSLYFLLLRAVLCFPACGLILGLLPLFGIKVLQAPDSCSCGCLCLLLRLLLYVALRFLRHLQTGLLLVFHSSLGCLLRWGLFGSCIGVLGQAAVASCWVILHINFLLQWSDRSLLSGKKNLVTYLDCFVSLCMAIVKFHCPFAGLNGCNDGGGNGLSRAYLIKHLRGVHCSGDAQAITKHALLSDLVVYERAELTLKRMGIWLCGVCFKTHTIRTKCRHGNDLVPPPDNGNGDVRFVLYDLTRPPVPSCSLLDHVDGLLPMEPEGFTLSLLDSLFSKGLRTVKSIPPKCRLGFSRVLKGALDKEESITSAIRSWGVPGGNLQLVRETLAESAPPMLDLDGVLSSSGVAPYNDVTLQELKTKHPFMSAPSLPDLHIDHHPLIASQDVVLDRIKNELVSSITQVVNLFLKGKCPMMLGEYIASAPLTPLVKPGGGICPIDVGTVWRRLVSKVSATMIGHSLDGYLEGLQFEVGVPGGGEAILHAVNCLVEDRGDDVGLSMLLVDFQNAFNLIVLRRALLVVIPRGAAGLGISTMALLLGDTLVVGKVLELITKDGPRCGLHLNVDKTELFWPKEDPKSRLEGIFPPNISRPLHGVKLLGGPVNVDVDIGSALVMKRVSKTIGLLDAVAKINDPQCELLLIRACAGVSKLYFAMRTYPPRVFESAQLSYDMALRSALERIVTASGLGFGDWQWRLVTLPFAFGGLGVYSACDVLNYVFVASRLQSAALQTKLLRHVGIVASGPTFDDALCVFNKAMEIDFLSTPSDVAAPKLMKKMADIYFTRVTKGAESFFSLSRRRMALWQSQREEHTLDWLRAGLGQTMNGKTYRCVLCYRLGVPLFSVLKPCPACSKVSTGDVYGDHAVSCAGVIGIKHRHNAVRDTLVDICFRSGISAGKEVDIGLGGGCDKALRPADMLLYSWEGGLDVCVDLTGSSPLTQTGMADFLPGRPVIDAAQRKRCKYMTKCADIEYGFLPFSFSSFGELEKDAVTLLKRVRKFSIAQDIGARAAVHIFNRISFSIAKGVGAQIVSRLPSNLL